MTQRGGKRAGAGRPKGQGKFGEPTKSIRVPLSRLTSVMASIEKAQDYLIPLYSSSVPAGFPSPADGHIDQHLDLNEHLIAHPAATFIVRASGDSMINAGIHSGDLLIVDRSLEPAHKNIVIAAINGELTVKRLWKESGHVRLRPENKNYPVIEIQEGEELLIWGVVTYVIHGTR